MSRYRQSKSKKPKIVTISTLIALLVAGGGWAFYQQNQDDNGSDNPDTFINLDPPTEEDERSGEVAKEELVGQEQLQQQANTSPDRQNQKQANVVIVDAGQYGNEVEVRAFISNHLERGTCHVTFSRAGTNISREATAHPDAQSTICTNTSVDVADFPSRGEWQVSVRYVSAGAEGVASQNLTIK